MSSILLYTVEYYCVLYHRSCDESCYEATWLSFPVTLFLELYTHRLAYQLYKSFKT